MRNEDEVMDLVKKVERDIGPIEVAVHNIGTNIRLPIRETTVCKYYKVWGMAALSAFLIGREVLDRTLMIRTKRGVII